MSRSLRALPSPATDPGAFALRALADVLAPLILERIATERAEGELVDVARFVAVDKQRAIAPACRSGAIPGAVKVARRWKAPASAVRGWLQAQGPRLVASNDDDDDLEAMRASLSRPGRRRSR